jgi:hypothetical protein
MTVRNESFFFLFPSPAIEGGGSAGRNTFREVADRRWCSEDRATMEVGDDNGRKEHMEISNRYFSVISGSAR